MSVDWLIKLWDKGGVALVMIVLLFLLAWFVGKRLVKAIDSMSANAAAVAAAVNTSSAAQIRAFSSLTDRVARVEGKIEAFGLVALGRPEQAQAVLAEHVSIAEEYGDTGVQELPAPQTVPIIPPLPKPKPKTPAKGAPYHLFNKRPATKGGGK